MAMLDQLKQYHSNPNEIEALNALANPSKYSGLVEMDERLIEYQLTIIPAFQPYRTWTVYKTEEGGWLVRRIAWSRSEPHNLAMDDADTYGADAKLPVEVAKDLSSQLSDITLPAFNIPETLGIDGVTFGVSKSGFFHRAELYWWCNPPEGWENLAKWFDSAVATFDSHLPELTPQN